MTIISMPPDNHATSSFGDSLDSHFNQEADSSFEEEVQGVSRQQPRFSGSRLQAQHEATVIPSRFGHQQQFSYLQVEGGTKQDLMVSLLFPYDCESHV